MVNIMDIMQLCRLCLVKDQVNIPIFEEQGDVRQIFLKITACLPVKVSRDDNLPKKICDGCLYKLELLYQFWNTTANAEKQLLSWLSQAGIEPNTKTTDKAMEIVAQSHAHPHSDNVENQIILKQESIDPDLRNDNVNDSLTLETNYVMQQQQLPYESFTFEQSGYEAETSLTETSALIENEVEDEPAPKRRRRAVKAVPIATQESDDENVDDVETMQITKTEEESEEEVMDESIESTSFVGISNTDNEQPGPSGVGKTSTEAPSNGLYYILITPRKIVPKSNSEKVVTCQQCGRTFKNKRYLRNHMKVHEERKYPCSMCDRKFLNKWLLKDHVDLDHLKKEIFKCGACGKHFSRKIGLVVHEKRHRKEFVARCDECDKGFVSRQDYKKHREVVHEGLRYTCNVCNKNYSTEGSFKEHMQRHDGTYVQTKVSCDICGQTYFSKAGLKAHYKKQHEKKRYICDVCGKSLTSQMGLTHHIRLHTGEKPCACEFCGKRFLKPLLLNRHRMIHTKEKPHKCKDCEKSFTQRSSLVMHIRSIHTGEKPYECHLCPQRFINKTLLGTHIKKKHNAIMPTKNDPICN